MTTDPLASDPRVELRQLLERVQEAVQEGLRIIEELDSDDRR